MNLEVALDEVDTLLRLLARHYNVELDKAGFITMASDMETIDERYLREKLYSRMGGARKSGVPSLSLRSEKLDLISRILNFEDFQDFRNYFKIDQRLLDFKGTYYSYVRKNAIEASVLQSPVRILRDGHQMIMRLKGRDRIFEGVLSLQGGAMSCLLTSSDREKSFYHIYKIGIVKNAMIIQGIFSGVSSFGEPIGGRCLLMKQEKDMDQLINSKIDLSIWEQDPDTSIFYKIAQYFKRYDRNNLSISKLSDYGLEI